MESFVYRDFDRLEEDHWWFAGRREVVAGFLQHHFGASRGLAILDVGCGTGGMLPMLARWGGVSAFDASDEALKAARRRAPTGARLWKGEVPRDIPADHRYDLVTMFDVLEHLDEPVEALRRVREALAPRGAVVITVPAFPFLWSRHDEVTHHRRRYTLETLRVHLEQAGLTLLDATHFNALLFPPIAAVRLAQRLVPVRDDRSDMAQTPKLANAVLRTLFAAERHVVGKAALPFGVSILALAS